MSIADAMSSVLGSRDPGGALRGLNYSLTQGNRLTMLPTPGLWGADPADNGYWQAVGPFTSEALTKDSRQLLSAITNVIANARHVVDIALLWHINWGLPDGFFHHALQQGFQRLRQAGGKPLIRVLCGIPTGPLVANQDLANWLKGLIPAGLSAYMATNHPATASWNHSKIVAADGKAAIVGGHNLWNSAYMSFAPIHDVSALIEGPAAATAHGFCDLLWSQRGSPLAYVHFTQDKVTHELPPMSTRSLLPPAAPVGKVPMMALGRLGAGIARQLDAVTDASVTARIVAILSAKSEIRIVQQSLGFQLIMSDISSFDIPTMRALAKMINLGRRVSIIMTNDGAQDGGGDPYSATPLKYTLFALGQFLQYEMRHPGPPRDRPLDYVHNNVRPNILGLEAKTKQIMNERVFLMPLRFSSRGHVWKAPGQKDRIAGLHAKVYQIDDQGFYVGSDNMYRSGTDAGLQEFGYFVDSQEETIKFQRAYWDQLWTHSNSARVHF